MASTRPVLSSALRAAASHTTARAASARFISYSAATRPPRSRNSAARPCPPASTKTTVASGRLGLRWSSDSAGAGSGGKTYDFEQIKSLSSSSSSSEGPSRRTLLIDVREPHELKSTGRIPTAVNIPITSAADSFHIPPDEFHDRYGFLRPDKDTELVFYCKAGVRSRAAAAIARDAGWASVAEYPGSWADWAAKGGEVQRG